MEQSLFKDSREKITRKILISFVSKYPKWKKTIKLNGSSIHNERIIKSIVSAWQPFLKHLDERLIIKALDWFMSDRNKKFIDFPPEPKTFVKAVEHFSEKECTDAKEKIIAKRRGLKYWNTVHLLASDKPIPNKYAFFKEEAKKDVNMYKTATHKNYLRNGKSEELCHCSHCNDSRSKRIGR
jgi:hypothetical protein